MSARSPQAHPQIPAPCAPPPPSEAQPVSEPQPSLPQSHCPHPSTPRATVESPVHVPCTPSHTVQTTRAPMPATAVPKPHDISDADTQEPVVGKGNLPVTVIDDSDVEHGNLSTQDSADGKMRAIIERINAHSDRSDDDDDAAANDDDVDFGHQVEDDASSNKMDGEKSAKKTKGKEEADSAEEDGELADMDHVEEDPEEEVIPKLSKQAKGKASRAKALKDKDHKSKKTKKEALAKVIKKQIDTKTKSRLVKNKGSAAARKKDSARSDAHMHEKDGSPAHSPSKSSKTSPRTSPTTSPKSKKSAAKDVPRGAAKADGKLRGKAVSRTAAGNAKEAKPKKTIGKPTAASRKPLLKKNEGKTASAMKTYSKKSASNSAKSSVVKKSPTKNVEKKKASKSEKKTPKKGKAKSRPISKSTEEEEDEMEIVSDAEENPSDVESEVEDTEETARTPASKHSMIGSLACSSRDPTCTALLDHAVQQLGRYSVVYYGPESNNKLSAYIIGKETKRGWGILQALASGIPLVSDEWLSTSISEGKWMPMDVYRSDKFGQSPTSVVPAASAINKIFDGHRVKVISHGSDLPSMRKLLRTCGARIAETRVDVVINDTEKAVDGHVNVTKKWLADSVEAGVVLDFDAYQLDN